MSDDTIEVWMANVVFLALRSQEVGDVAIGALAVVYDGDLELLEACSSAMIGCAICEQPFPPKVTVGVVEAHMVELHPDHELTEPGTLSIAPGYVDVRVRGRDFWEDYAERMKEVRGLLVADEHLQAKTIEVMDRHVAELKADLAEQIGPDVAVDLIAVCERCRIICGEGDVESYGAHCFHCHMSNPDETPELGLVLMERGAFDEWFLEVSNIE